MSCQEADAYCIPFKWVVTRSALLTIPRNPLTPQDWTISSQDFHSDTALSSIWNGISASLPIFSLASLTMLTDFIISHQKDHHCLLMMKFRLWNGFSEGTLSLRKPCSRNSTWNYRVLNSSNSMGAFFRESLFLTFQTEVFITHITCLSQGFLMHYHKAASENPSNETAVAKFFMSFSKLIPLLVFLVVPGNSARLQHLSSLCCDIFQQVAGCILIIPTQASDIILRSWSILTDLEILFWRLRDVNSKDRQTRGTKTSIEVPWAGLSSG